MTEHLHQASIELTVGQREAAQAVVAAFEAGEGRKTIVSLQGFSGVGKTTLARHIRNANPLLNIHVVARKDLIYDSKGSNHTHARILTSSKPPLSVLDEEMEKRLDKTSSVHGFTREIVTIKGMTEDEMADFLDRRHLDSAGVLPRRTIIKYSLGVPSLAMMLCRHGLTEDMAVSISGGYLAQNVGRATDITKYLAYQQIAREVTEKAKQLRDFGSRKEVYDDLASTMQRQQELAGNGVRHEDPFFIAPESKAIYDEMLQKLHGMSGIDIFVPQLSDEVYGHIISVVGVEAVSGSENRQSRSKMFPMEWRKVSIWQQASSGRIEFVDDEYYGVEEAARNFQRAYKSGRLGLPANLDRNNAFWLHAHAHRGEINPAIVGYMVETLLQQRGVSYFVNNETLRRSYWYDSSEKHIVPLDKQVRITKYDDGSEE